MHVLKTMLIIVLGLGAVTVARYVAPGASAGLLTGVAYARTPNDTGAVQSAQTPAKTASPTEEQLAEINAALASEGELKEFKPTEPLSADEAIEMSSEL